MEINYLTHVVSQGAILFPAYAFPASFTDPDDIKDFAVLKGSSATGGDLQGSIE